MPNIKDPIIKSNKRPKHTSWMINGPMLYCQNEINAKWYVIKWKNAKWYITKWNKCQWLWKNDKVPNVTMPIDAVPNDKMPKMCSGQ